MRNDEEADGIWEQNIPVFFLILTSFPFHIPQLSIFFPEIQDSKMWKNKQTNKQNKLTANVVTCKWFTWN